MRLILAYVTLMTVLHRAAGSQMVFALSARDRESILHKTCLPRLATYTIHDPESKAAFEIQSGAPRCTPQLVVCHVNDTRAYDQMKRWIRWQDWLAKERAIDKAYCYKPSTMAMMNMLFLIVFGCLLLLAIVILMILLIVMKVR